jgi:hypothetical protein
LTSAKPVTWTNDIKNLFTATDVDRMKQAGGFDLSSYQDVKVWAAAIYTQVANGTMPPPGIDEDPWTPEMVNTFGYSKTARNNASVALTKQRRRRQGSLSICGQNLILAIRHNHR